MCNYAFFVSHTTMQEYALLVDLPTFPQGTLSLSLFTVAGALLPHVVCEYADLNFEEDVRAFNAANFNKYSFVGLKVSSQNYAIAKKITEHIRQTGSTTKVVWGGELPTLLKAECLLIADCIVTGLFESICKEFVSDLQTGRLKREYIGNNRSENGIATPDFSILNNKVRYNSFMGMPLETSRGCTQRCLFCMVLVMQARNYYVQTPDQLLQNVQAVGAAYLNIVDYNLGVDKTHVLRVASFIQSSEVLGWMAEMNIEMLDDDEVLAALQRSRCRMIYCGLETIDEVALKSVNKDQTNKVENYERIIRKVQRYGIDIAAGMIIGLDGAEVNTYRQTLDFYNRMGVIYTKFTFLIYNPGTKVKEYMGRRGQYATEDISRYDGNSITYLPEKITEQELYALTAQLMSSYYAWPTVVKRAIATCSGVLHAAEYILFNWCYSRAYHTWQVVTRNTSHPDFSRLLAQPYKKGIRLRLAEQMLTVVRKWRKAYGK